MDIPEALKNEISSLKTHLNSKIEEANKSLEKSYTDKVDSHVKKEVKALSDLLGQKELALQGAIDKLDAQVRKGLIQRDAETKSFEDLIMDNVMKEGFQQAVRENKAGQFMMDITGKAIGTMTEAASLTGEVIAPNRRESILELAQRPVHIRSLIPQGTMTSNVFRYVQETAGEGAADMTAEGVNKSQVDYDLDAIDSPVRKITAFARISEEMIDDIPALTSFLSRRLTKDIRKKEDSQLLYGSGSGQNLTGLNQNATAFIAFAADSNAQIIDLVIAVYSTIESLEYEASGVLLSPKDYYTIYTAKDANGAYVKQDLVNTLGGQLFIAGIPVFRNTAVNVGEYFIGDWLNGAQIFDRKGVNVRFYDQDEDNAQKNLITVIAEERLAFPIYYPDSFVFGTLATDIAKIQDFT